MNNNIDIMTLATAIATAIATMNGTTVPQSVATATTTTTTKDGLQNPPVWIPRHCYAWTHKHDKTGKPVILIAVDGKIDKPVWKRLKATMAERYNARYSKFMSAFVVYEKDVATFRKTAKNDGFTIHKKAPAFYRGMMETAK